ncbi:MAG: SRPBCC domain-containing protein [Nitrospinae bacterium]|nr:SRPBCC domain-containing protein [Nitrospinota bacterium]
MTQEFKVTDRDIVTTRVFRHPVTKVWKAWTSPDLIPQWFGPDGFTTTFHQFEFSPGGKWIFTMHGPDGKDYPNEAVFDEIIENHLIRYRHISKPEFDVEIRFEEAREGTKLTFVQRFASKEIRDMIAVYAEPANEQIMTKLDGVASAVL